MSVFSKFTHWFRFLSYLGTTNWWIRPGFFLMDLNKYRSLPGSYMLYHSLHLYRSLESYYICAIPPFLFTISENCVQKNFSQISNKRQLGKAHNLNVMRSLPRRETKSWNASIKIWINAILCQLLKLLLIDQLTISMSPCVWSKYHG